MIYKLLFFFCLCIYSFNSFSKNTIDGKPKIIDGDTLHIDKNKIRLHGIDAPELNQTCTINNNIWNCGIESTMALKNLILDKEVYCEIIDKDKYKRFVGICYLNNQNINKYMVRNGWAIAYRYYSLDFVEDEKLAKKDKIGLWQGKFQEPYLYRKSKKK